MMLSVADALRVRRRVARCQGHMPFFFGFTIEADSEHGDFEFGAIQAYRYVIGM